MKKDKIIKAITIGISAMMAMNASMTTFAEGEEDQAPDNTPNENIEESAPAAPTEVQEAGNQIAEQATQTESAIDNAASNAEEMMTQLTDNVNEGDGGTIAAPAIEELATQVEEATDNQLVETIQDSNEVVEEVVADVEVAVAQNDIVEEEATNAVEAVDTVVTTAENMAGLVEDTNEEAQVLIEQIENADTPEAAQETYEELQELVAQTQETVSLQQDTITEMTNQYIDARNKLLEAEAAYETAIQNAEDNIDEVASQLAQAQATVENLETALEDAQEKLEYEQREADTLNDYTLKANWDSQRAYMKLLVVYYIIPQMDGEMVDPDSVVIATPPGFDTQDCKYSSFTYTDSNGNEVTRYFNYDRTDKKITGSIYNGLGSSTQIVVFEKDIDEIMANDHLFEYYDGVNFSRSDLMNKANSGEFDVFVYTDSEQNKTYLVREELNAAVANGDIVQTESGYELVDGTPVTKIVQNANSKVHGGEFAIDLSDAPDFQTFLASADSTYEQYEALSSVVGDAKEAIEDAQEEVEKLNDAIGTLKNKHGNPVLKAIDALGVSDVATYLGITVTPEQADLLNEMTVPQAIEYLDAILASANDAVEQAAATLDALNEKLDEIAESLDIDTDGTGDDGTGENENGEGGSGESGAGENGSGESGIDGVVGEPNVAGSFTGGSGDDDPIIDGYAAYEGDNTNGEVIVAYEGDNTNQDDGNVTAEGTDGTTPAGSTTEIADGTTEIADGTTSAGTTEIVDGATPAAPTAEIADGTTPITLTAENIDGTTPTPDNTTPTITITPEAMTIVISEDVPLANNPNAGTIQTTGIVTPSVLTGGAAVQTTANANTPDTGTTNTGTSNTGTTTTVAANTNPVIIQDGGVALTSGTSTLQAPTAVTANGAIEISDEIVARSAKAVEDEESPKSALPFSDQEEKQQSLFWWWLVLLAAMIAGAKKYSENVKEFNDTKYNIK